MTKSRLTAILLSIGLPIALIIGGGLAFYLLGALKPPPEEEERGPVGLAVFAAEALLQDVRLSISAQGEVTPRRQVELSPQVAGRVTYVSPNLVNGGFVKQGELLMKLEDADYKLAAVRAESTVASASQGLALVIAEAELARRELEELNIENPSSLALREPQVAEAKAALAAAEAQAQDAALQLRRTALRAPFDGLVTEKSVDIGQYVSPGRAIGTVFATDVVQVELPIASRDLGDIGVPIAFNASPETPGPTVTLSAEVGGRMRNWTGRITRTGASVDPGTRLVSVFVEVQDPFGAGADDDAPLAPGLYVTALIEGRHVDDVIIVPRPALRGLDEVYVVEQSDAPASDVAAQDEDAFVLRIRKVGVLRSTKEHVYITSGLEPGELSIISPVQAPFDGMRVRLISSKEASEMAASPKVAASSSAATGAGAN